MNIFLLGATGKTGSLFLKMALENGHRVTAYVRSPEKMTHVIVSSMQTSRVGKIAAISTAGIHSEFSLITNFILKLFYKHVINDHRLAAQIIITSGLEYTLARPLSLTEGPLTKAYRKTTIGVPKGGKAISRQDLAHFLLHAIENGEHSNETLGLSY